MGPLAYLLFTILPSVLFTFPFCMNHWWDYQVATPDPANQIYTVFLTIIKLGGVLFGLAIFGFIIVPDIIDSFGLNNFSFYETNKEYIPFLVFLFGLPFAVWIMRKWVDWGEIKKIWELNTVDVVVNGKLTERKNPPIHDYSRRRSPRHQTRDASRLNRKLHNTLESFFLLLIRSVFYVVVVGIIISLNVANPEYTFEFCISAFGPDRCGSWYEAWFPWVEELLYSIRFW